MTPAAELRAAADKLRTLTEAVNDDIATNPYWGSDEHPPHAYPNLYTRGVDNGLGGPAGQLASTMGPDLSTALAQWLTTEAETWAGDEVHYRCSPQACTLDAALAVARSILGGGA